MLSRAPNNETGKRKIRRPKIRQIRVRKENQKKKEKSSNKRKNVQLQKFGRLVQLVEGAFLARIPNYSCPYKRSRVNCPRSQKKQKPEIRLGRSPKCQKKRNLQTALENERSIEMKNTRRCGWLTYGVKRKNINKDMRVDKQVKSKCQRCSATSESEQQLKESRVYVSRARVLICKFLAKILGFFGGHVHLVFSDPDKTRRVLFSILFFFLYS